MSRWSYLVLLAAGFTLLTAGQTEKGPAQKDGLPPAAPGQTPKKATTAKPESLLDWVLRITGISATSRGLKGDHLPMFSGELWTVDISTLLRVRVGTHSHCRTPVFANDDKSILALCQEGLTRISLESGESHELTKPPVEIERLLGTDRTSEPNALRIVVVTPQGLSIFVPSSGQLSTLGIPSDSNPSLVTSLEEEPQYGSVRLASHLSDVTAGTTRGAEIFMETGGTSKRLTQCAPRMCDQGALSHDGKTVVFVRRAE